MMHAQPFADQPVFGLDHILIIVEWKPSAHTIRRLGGFAVANAIRQNDIVLACV